MSRCICFFLSPFEKSDVLTIDGHGEEETCYLGSFSKNNLKKIDSIKYPHSLGLFYGTFTDFLGFKPDVDEWKVMALSSYSKKNTYLKKVLKLIKFTKDGFELDLSYFDYFTFDKKNFFFTKKIYRFVRKRRQKMKRFYKNIMKLLLQCNLFLKKQLIIYLKY